MHVRKDIKVKKNHNEDFYDFHVYCGTLSFLEW